MFSFSCARSRAVIVREQKEMHTKDDVRGEGIGAGGGVIVWAATARRQQLSWSLFLHTHTLPAAED